MIFLFVVTFSVKRVRTDARGVSPNGRVERRGKKKGGIKNHLEFILIRLLLYIKIEKRHIHTHTHTNTYIRAISTAENFLPRNGGPQEAY